MAKLRRPFLSGRSFFVTVRLLRRRPNLTEPDFALLAQAFNRARALHHFLLTAWAFIRDHWHAIAAPQYPVTISLAVKTALGAKAADRMVSPFPAVAPVYDRRRDRPAGTFQGKLRPALQQERGFPKREQAPALQSPPWRAM